MRVLFFDYQYPNPKHDSGSQDLLGYARILRELGFSVGFISFSESKPDDEVSRFFTVNGISHWAMGQHNEAAQFQLKEELRNADYVWIQRIIVFNHIIGWVDYFESKASVIFGTVDLHFLREMRLSLTRRSFSKFLYSLMILRQELGAMRRADATVVVSFKEKNVLSFVPKIGQKVFHIPLPRDLEQGKNAFSIRDSIGFIGGYEHQPNIDAVHYFLDHIWPLILKMKPDITFRIAGSKMPSELKEKAESIQGVLVQGFVDNTYDFFNQLRISVAPLRFGAGVKGKILTSILHGVPVVASKVAAEGMGLRNGVDIEVANSAHEFATLVVNLFENEQHWSKLRKNGRDSAVAMYSEKNVSKIIDNMLKEMDCRGASNG